MLLLNTPNLINSENYNYVVASYRVYGGPSFDTIIDLSTRNTTIKLFLPFKLIKQLDIDIQVLLLC